MGSSLFGGLISALIGGGEKPRASTRAVQETEAAARKSKTSRSALFSTEGGVAGEELDATGVAKRNTLLGN